MLLLEAFVKIMEDKKVRLSFYQVSSLLFRECFFVSLTALIKRHAIVNDSRR